MSVGDAMAPVDLADATDERRFGGKAVQLGAAIRAGLPVLDGFALAADFAEAGLLDEVQLSIAPVTLGAGRPLFPRPFDLRLESSGRNGAFLVATYAVVGPRKKVD